MWEGGLVGPEHRSEAGSIDMTVRVSSRPGVNRPSALQNEMVYPANHHRNWASVCVSQLDRTYAQASRCSIKNGILPSPPNRCSYHRLGSSMEGTERNGFFSRYGKFP